MEEEANINEDERFDLLDETQVLSAMLWISELLSGKSEMEELLQTVVELTPKLLRVNRSTIMLYDKESKEFIPRISYSPDGKERHLQLAAFYSMRLKELDMSDSLKKIIADKVPIVVKDAEHSDVIPEEYIKYFKIKSMLIVPLLCRGEFMGIMTLDHMNDFHHFTQNETRIALGLAAQAAIAIKNAQLISSLKESEERNRKIMDTMVDGLLVLSPDRRILAFNSAIGTILGVPAQEMVGHHCQDVFCNGIVKGDINICETLCPVANSSINTENINIEGVVVTRDNRRKWISSNYSHLLDVDGNVVYTVVTVRDITDKKQLEEKLYKVYEIIQKGKMGHEEKKDVLGGF